MGLLDGTDAATAADGLLAIDTETLATEADPSDVIVLPARLFTDLHRAGSVYQVAEAILRWIPTVVDGDNWTMGIDHDEDSVEVVSLAPDGSLVTGEVFARHQSLIGRAFERSDLALACDFGVRDEPDARLAGDDGLRSGICHPVVHRGRVVATLNCASREPDRYTTGDILRLRALAELAGFHLAMRDRIDEAERLASLDPLTGTANRRAYVDWLEARLAKTDGPSFALGLLDLDHFKRVNDTFGHEAGDQVLVQVADCLRAAVRDADLVARFGGEEFALLIEGADEAIAGVVFDRVVDRVRHLELDDAARGWTITASIGGAVRRAEDRTVRDIFERADRAVYEAKAQGRDRVVMAD